MSYTRHSFIDQLKKVWQGWPFFKKGLVLSLLFCVSLSLSTIWDLYGESNRIDPTATEEQSKSWIHEKISGFDKSRYLMAGSVLVMAITLWAIRLSTSIGEDLRERQSELKSYFIESHRSLISKLSQEQLDKLIHSWDQTLQELSVIKSASLSRKQPLSSQAESPSLTTPFDQVDRSPGKEALKNGEVAVLLLAGGQGTRLGYEGPKGCYPITPVRQLSLFGLFAEKLHAAKRKYGSEIPLAVMCSQGNLDASKAHFEINNYFGLDKESVSFFLQGELPITDSEHKCLLSPIGEVLKGPDGNGALFHNLEKSGVLANWKSSRIRYISTVPVDNPLFDPVDEALISSLILNKAPMSAAVVYRVDEQEKVGVFAKEGGKTKVLEYSELPEELNTKDKEGNLSFAFANISVFAWDMDFIEKLLSIPIEKTVLHRAVKTQKTLTGEVSNLSKWEWFIFDWMEELEEEIPLIIYDRSLAFSPLKSLFGSGSEQEVQESLLGKDQYIYEQVTKKRPSEGLFEIGGSWHYPSSDFIQSVVSNPGHPPEFFKGESPLKSAFPEQA